MTIEFAFHSDFPDQLVRETLQSALRDQAGLARFRHEQFMRECEAFEQRFGMTTAQFQSRFDLGELGDAAEFFDWFAAARGQELWKQKAEILGQVVG